MVHAVIKIQSWCGARMYIHVLMMVIAMQFIMIYYLWPIGTCKCEQFWMIWLLAEWLGCFMEDMRILYVSGGGSAVCVPIRGSTFRRMLHGVCTVSCCTTDILLSAVSFIQS